MATPSSWPRTPTTRLPTLRCEWESRSHSQSNFIYQEKKENGVPPSKLKVVAKDVKKANEAKEWSRKILFGKPFNLPDFCHLCFELKLMLWFDLGSLLLWLKWIGAYSANILWRSVLHKFYIVSWHLGWRAVVPFIFMAAPFENAGIWNLERFSVLFSSNTILRPNTTSFQRNLAQILEITRTPSIVKGNKSLNLVWFKWGLQWWGILKYFPQSRCIFISHGSGEK